MIALDGVSAAIGGRTVLEGVSLTVAAGELVALCGPNGAGKSSVLRAACGLLPVTAGTVRLEGDPVRGLTEPERAARIAFLPQERRIAWNMAAVEIAALGLPFLPGDQARARARAALEEVGAGPLADRGVAEMSGGERARVLIARVLATGAKALALDEPVAGLDPDAAFLVMGRLKARAAAGQGVLVSLHDLPLAAGFADRIVMIDGGRVVADGPPREALSPGVLGEVFRVAGEWGQGPDNGLRLIRRG
ncbi:MAG: ABC transporter ATP-binding protein [Brevundimonas sp.]|uniref:ABC transporter ATP-binding protein n=1 Tax=Brevundimonas sp. TaxID=1871086 RepID=UPI00273405CA|nr:ABC transporter ATP-binding protein [Brevundimonas sp.]MDP3406098.1 ABC transporter ATP-binding protein [Brevundimonas sp.]